MVSYIMYLVFVLIIPVLSLEWPVVCKPGQFYDPGSMSCQNCAVNASLVTSHDGFSCTCEENSFQMSPTRCQRCSSTEVLSTDATSCVPKRCQKDSASGRVVCRKCPNDYISATQNIDGSPMREMQCVKCKKGYKPLNNQCVRCESCNCPKNHVPVLDKCVPKTFLVNRPKYEEKVLHPSALLNVVKHEYFCTEGDTLACRALANECVRNFYTTDRGGPCRLWLHPATLPRPTGLPKLLVDTLTKDGRKPGEIRISSNIDGIFIVAASHTADGRMELFDKLTEAQCLLPVFIQIGKDFSRDCYYNVTYLDNIDSHSTLVPYLKLNGDYQQLPVIVRKSNNRIVQRGEWSSNKFSRFFLLDTYITNTANISSTVYLRILIVNISIERDNSKPGHLNIEVSIEAQYAIKSPLSTSVPFTLRVQHQLPGAGVLRGLEIWGGVLGALLALYAIVQWRGALRRGGHHISIIPIMSGCISDALYFAVLFSTLHALAAEAGTLGLTLPLSNAEEHITTAFIYSAISLKIVKVIWINWKQCTCDIFLLDWSEYNTQTKEATIFDKCTNWRVTMVAREWSLMQVRRRVTPGYTVVLTLVILHLTRRWQANLLESRGYTFVFLSSVWWSAYCLLLSARWLLDKSSTAPTAALPKVCTAAGVSLLVFQEEYYAHYVHGRNDDSPDSRTLAGPLSNCRVICVPQFRMVYKQLSAGHGPIGHNEDKRTLLTRFLAAFFERALEGMRWMASERSLPERLLDVELTARESSTSVLLYHTDDVEPSCFALTWWREEWSIGSLEAIVFSCVVVTGGDAFLASLVILTVWQITKYLRMAFGDRNLKIKMDIMDN